MENLTPTLILLWDVKRSIQKVLNFFLSGHMFPLDMVREPWKTIFELSPLQFLAYFPAAVFLGKIQGEALIRALLIEAAWVAFFMVLARGTFNAGLKRYAAYGG